MKIDEQKDRISLQKILEIPYHYSGGVQVSRFLRELKYNKRFVGVKCPNCGKIYVPPRIVCKECFVKTEEFVQVSDKGTVIGYTVTSVPYTNPRTGEPKRLPFTTGYIRLDGSDSNILHRLEELDEKKLKTGMRVLDVFNEDCTGDHFFDIKFFRTIA